MTGSVALAKQLSNSRTEADKRKITSEEPRSDQRACLGKLLVQVDRREKYKQFRNTGDTAR